MNILQLAPKVPFPLDEGGRISIYGTTRELALAGAKIYFVALSADPGRENLGDLHKWCQEVKIIRHKKKYGVSTIVRSLFSKVPLNILKFQSTTVLHQLKQFVSLHRIDLIHVDYLHMAYYGLALKSLLSKPAALREHDLEIKMMQRFAQAETKPHLKYAAWIQFRRFLKYQPEICSRFDRCIMVSRADERDLVQLAPRVKTEVIPIGVDTDYFRPNDAIDDGATIGYLGSLDWFANIHGIRWFVKEVLPLIVKEKNRTRLFIYGSNPTDQVLRLADGDHVFVRGHVEDAREAFRHASVFIAPETVGSGIRIKILEAMAMGKPVVATTVSSEGIEAEHGKALLVADKPLDFARQVSSLLSSQRLRRSVSINARKAVLARYSWNKVGRRFAQTYQSILKNHDRN